jgi:hypothetical protein
MIFVCPICRVDIRIHLVYGRNEPASVECIKCNCMMHALRIHEYKEWLNENKNND